MRASIPHQAMVLAIAAATSAALWPTGMRGIVAGGGITWLSQWASQKMLRHLARGGPRVRALALLLGLKSIVVLAAVTLVLVLLRPNVWGFGLGLSTYFISLCSAMLTTSRAELAAKRT